MSKRNHCSFSSNGLYDNATILPEGCSEAGDIEHLTLYSSGRMVPIYRLETETDVL